MTHKNAEHDTQKIVCKSPPVLWGTTLFLFIIEISFFLCNIGEYNYIDFIRGKIKSILEIGVFLVISSEYLSRLMMFHIGTKKECSHILFTAVSP